MAKRQPGRPKQFPHVLTLAVSEEIMDGLERAQQAFNTAARQANKYTVSHIAREALEAWLMSYCYLVPPQPQQPSPNGGNQHVPAG